MLIIKRLIYYFLGILILILGLLGIQRLTLKADLPFDCDTGLTGVVVNSDYDNIQKGYEITAIDNHQVETDFQLEFIIDNKSIGENVNLTFLYGGDSQKNLTVKLVPYYRNSFFILISLIVGILFWLTAFFVISKKSDDKSAVILFWILMLFGLATMTSTSTFYSNDLIGYLIRIAHTSSYIMGIAFFLHFTFIFPVRRLTSRNLFFLIYITAVIVSLSIGYYQYISFQNVYSSSVLVYDKLWRLVELLLLMSILAGTLYLIISYKKIKTKEERTKVEWLFWGLAGGASPFLIFWIVPRVFPVPAFFKEEYLLAFLVIIPFSFGIAVVRHRIFDIEIVVKRSIVYFIMTILVIMSYFGIVSLISSLTHGLLGLYRDFTSLAVTFIIALLFNPVCKRLHKFVDRNLYNIKYDFEKAKSAFKVKIKNCKTPGELGKVTINEIESLIPVKFIGFVITDESGKRLKILAQKQLDNLANNISAFRVRQLHSDFNLPFALEEKVEPGVEIDNKLEQVLRKWEISLVMPLVIDSNIIIGALIFGEKISNLRFMRNDIDLLNTLSNNTAFTLNRLQLQEKLMLERIEREKLAELTIKKEKEAQALFTRMLIESQELERKRIASELHDSLGQNLLIIKNKLLLRIKNDEQKSATDNLDEISDMTSNAIEEVRSISHNLRPFELDRLGLTEAILSIAENVNSSMNINVETDIDNIDNVLTKEFEINFYRIIQECMNNIIKHSNAKNSILKIKRTGTVLITLITDDGVGFDVENIREQKKGLGLIGIQERVNILNGHMYIYSEENNGTRIEITIPANS